MKVKVKANIWTIENIRDWAQGARAEIRGTLSDCVIGGFSINTKTIQPGDIFIALKGEKHDGHAFIDDAFQKGAAGAMVSHAGFESLSGLAKSRLLIVVEDPLTGLQSLAAWHRQSFHGSLIGVTGTNGKTTTKEILAKILGTRGSVLKTEGNFNNQIGLPLSLLRLGKEDRAAVLEMGVSRPGDMRLLCDIAKPTAAIITNIGSAHLEFLKNVEGVAAEKGVLFESLASDGIAIINRDDSYLSAWEERIPNRWTYSIERDADITASDIEQLGSETAFTLVLNRNQAGGGGKMRVVLPLIGRHQVYNALAASALAIALGYEFDEIRAALSEVRPVSLRGEVISYQGATVLLDAYNANPASMQSGLQTLAAYSPPKNGVGHRKVALLGDMLELGESSKAAHRETGRTVARNHIDRLITVGNFSEAMAEGAIEGGMEKEAVSVFKTLEAIDLAHEIQKGDIVLIKGSRGMGMERLIKGTSH